MVACKSLGTLRDGVWVNDEVLNFSVKQLNLTRGGRRRGGGGGGGSGGAARGAGDSISGGGGTGNGSSGGSIATGACTFAKPFYRQSAALLEACPTGNGGFRRLTSKAGITAIFAINKLCMPINLGRKHWLLGVIDMAGKRFIIYNSMSQTHRDAYSAAFDNLARILEHEAAATLPAAAAFSTAGWEQLSPGLDVRQQDGVVDCGVFTLMFARCLSRGEALSFSMADVPFLRRPVLLDILLGNREILASP
ncbi:unnamed protein product, partial [Phaeothamnion confervicola]